MISKIARFIKAYYIGYLFIAPALIILAVFLFFPIVQSFLMSLTDYKITSMHDVHFIGIKNYLKLFQDQIFLQSLLNTAYFVFVGAPLSMVVSLFMAVILNEKFIKYKTFFRASFFAPVVTTVVAVAVIWRWLYQPDYGLFNWALRTVGINPVNWLSDVRFAMPSLILMSVWKGFGYNMIIFIAGLQTIPETLYESARIDGANWWKCFRYITLPGLRHTILFVTIMTTIGFFQFFGESYVMTKGGPLNSTISIVYYMYNQGFKFFNLGYASAIAYVLFGLIFSFTMIQLWLRPKYSGED
ncbi:MAG: sugar ABC transporter permease [Elusimicrobiota bacterium]